MSLIATKTAQGIVGDVHSDELREKVLAEIRRIWLRPNPSPKRFAVARNKVEETAEAALDAMLVRDFRITPFPPADEYAQLLSRVRHWVRRAKPIQIMLGYAPMKNPRSVDHTHADWAEFFALSHLCAWHNKVAKVYPPGLRITIIFDDSTIRMANRYDWLPMNDYMGSIARLIPAMGYDQFIAGTMRQSSFAWLFYFGFYQLAGIRVRRWERDPVNRDAVERMLEFSRRNVVLPSQLSEKEQERRHREAAHRYRVYWEALQLSGFSRCGHKLVAMYLDGTQHHIRQSAALHLRSVGRQQGTQPWQGEGAVWINENGKLVPIVLTAKRRQEMDCRKIQFSGVLPLEGFDSMLVGWNSTSAIPENGNGASVRRY